MGRTPCCDKIGLKKGKWTAEEDQKLIAYINLHGEQGSWRSLPKNAGLLRCGKSCRLRWMNYLRSDVKRGNFTEHEEETIVKLHNTLGNRWSLIASHLPGRTDNDIKNYWNSHLSRTIYRFRSLGASMVPDSDMAKIQLATASCTGKTKRASPANPNETNHYNARSRPEKAVMGTEGDFGQVEEEAINMQRHNSAFMVPPKETGAQERALAEEVWVDILMHGKDNIPEGPKLGDHAWGWGWGCTDTAGMLNENVVMEDWYQYECALSPGHDTFLYQEEFLHRNYYGDGSIAAQELISMWSEEAEDYGMWIWA